MNASSVIKKAAQIIAARQKIDVCNPVRFMFGKPPKRGRKLLAGKIK